MGNKRLKLSDEHKRKIGLSNKGKIRTLEVREAKRLSMIGRKLSQETRLNMSLASKGKKKSITHVKNMSLAKRGNKSYLWRGGVSSINKLIRSSLEYRLWRKAVFERDNYTCIWCGVNRKNEGEKRMILNADHIKPFAFYPELRFAIDNGRTLCIDCHMKTESFGRKYK